MKQTLCLLCCTLLLIGCKDRRYQVPGSPKKNLSIVRFERQFQTNDPNLDKDFLALYATKIMEVGEPGSETYRAFSNLFHTHADIINLYDTCEQVFPDVRKLEKSLTLAFHRLTYYFPTAEVPVIYTHISGYGQSIVSAPKMLSASLDKYLGINHPLYKLLFEPYQYQRMYPEKMLSDYLFGWIQSEWTRQKQLTKNRLLDHIIYEGKILFLTSLVLPDEPKERLFSFTPSQLAWCQKHEKEMWDGLVQHQLLFSTDQQVLSRLLDEAATTTYFPGESPGRAVTWIGYKIVEAYMKRNPAVSVQALMANTDAQVVLNGSVYHP